MRTTTVMVADDDPVVRVLVNEFLSARGFNVQSAENAAQCLEKLEDEVPDVLVLDLLMPDMTGIEVLRQLRSNPRTSAIPVVMLSADYDIEALVGANHISADEYVQKPFGAKEILSAIEHLIPKKAP